MPSRLVRCRVLTRGWSLGRTYSNREAEPGEIVELDLDSARLAQSLQRVEILKGE